MRLLSYHAASTSIAVVTHDGHIEKWQTDPQIASAPQADSSASCVRKRLEAAQAEIKDVEASLEEPDDDLREQISRENEVKRSIADFEAKFNYLSETVVFVWTSMKRDLEEMQTEESREYWIQMKRHSELLGIINDCTKTLDSLTDCLAVSGLENLCGDAFMEWLCDIGMSKLQTELKDTDGVSLTMLNVGDVMDNGVSFSDAAALLLRGYIAHFKLGEDRGFSPPRDSVLSWDIKQTANWIVSLDAPFSSLFTSGWNGAALCSLSPPRVIEASKGKLNAADAVKFIGLVRKMRSETDGDKATWVSKWSGASTIDNQAASHSS